VDLERTDKGALDAVASADVGNTARRVSPEPDSDGRANYDKWRRLCVDRRAVLPLKC